MACGCGSTTTGYVSFGEQVWHTWTSGTTASTISFNREAVWDIWTSELGTASTSTVAVNITALGDAQQVWKIWTNEIFSGSTTSKSSGNAINLGSPWKPRELTPEEKQKRAEEAEKL